ncbi:cytochrome P450 [Dacryopinax primogenitus]|uniref:Cytochrome P450 n=1 Tax=Dacryopinax primogenitus (strain DJM 731) TaxID=1858805 RepID=M5G336_DACPD|nr:cytochrome P450 [Dacryopinax primogenitus]EJU02635.1 cytochrome P450 [Dacryopinax primogenitus]
MLLLFPALGAAAVVLLLSLLLRQRSRLPPGPRPYPLLGNLLSLPSRLLHARLHAWVPEYGDLYTIHIGPLQPAVVLSSARALTDVLDKLGRKTSGRPRLIYAGEIMTKKLLYAFMPYGERWRWLRRVTHEGFNIRACEAYYPFQISEASHLVLSLLPSTPTSPTTPNTPESLPEKLKHATAASIWRTLYSGPTLTPADEALVQRVDRISDDVLKAGMPLAHLVDVIPALNRLPSWMAKWKRDGEEWFEETDRFFKSLLQKGRKVEQGENARGFIATTAPSFEKLEVTEQEAAWTAGGLFGAAAETTSATLYFFILAMILHPFVAQTAQKTLEALCASRPPSFADRENLPYITAVVKELLRWRPVAALGLPHVAEEDVEYRGYVIPKGTLLIGNTWSISHDPAFFSSPDTFDPLRFLTAFGEPRTPSPEYHDDTVAYGAGRRICPGRDFANNTLWINVAFLLWAFDFLPGADSEGEVWPNPDRLTDHGLVIHPAPFEYTLRPRRTDLHELLASA